METTHWVHNLDPVAIHLWGDVGIRYYGLSYLLGFVIGYWMLWYFYKKGKSPLDNKQLTDAMLAIIIGVMVGGRIGYVIIYNLSGFLSDPLMIFQIWKGGMASHGGFIGVALATWWITKKFKVPYLKLGDILCAATAPGLFLGRTANFINGELWGKVSNVPWAVIFPKSAPVGTPIDQIAPRHPSQLYEAGLEGLLLLIWTQFRIWKTDVLERPGRLLGEFFCLYSVGRTIAESFKWADQPLILGVTQGIFYSSFIFLVGAWLIGRDIYRKRKDKKA